jgi:hypothetical protein
MWAKLARFGGEVRLAGQGRKRPSALTGDLTIGGSSVIRTASMVARCT